MKIFLATKNPGKISEFREILSGLNVDLVTCNDLEIPDVDETGSSFVETDKYLIGETYPQENFVFMEVFEKTIYVGIKDMYGNTLNSISVNY